LKAEREKKRKIAAKLAAERAKKDALKKKLA